MSLSKTKGRRNTQFVCTCAPIFEMELEFMGQCNMGWLGGGGWVIQYTDLDTDPEGVLRNVPPPGDWMYSLEKI